VQDVITTLEEQLKVLKKQARQASRYRNLSDHIRRAEAMLLALKLDTTVKDLARNQEDLKESEAIVNDLTRLVAGAAATQADAAAGLPALRQSEAEAAARLQRLRVAADGLEQEERRIEAARAATRERLEQIAERTLELPAGFHPHPKIAKLLEQRAEMGRDERPVDYGMAEHLAFASLLAAGVPVRLSGQDTRRATFNQRHAVLIDVETEAEHVPLRELAAPGAFFEIYDSMLSEAAVMGFEYGFARDYPEALVLWEAQFGDFVNGAQIIVDQYLVAAEDKWGQQSGIVLLLPHGYEGQGPEHSSARIERFLTACAEDNIQVANATTAAQYFHLLRRQMHREVRKPLIVFTPKSLLRAKPARSKLDELSGTTTFLEVLPDPTYAGDAGAVQRVVLASGKVGHDAIAERDKRGANVPVLRAEQLYPWPTDHLAEALAAYPSLRELVWLQEEPENMGPWGFVKGRLYEELGDRLAIRRVSRHESGSPATGSKAVHDQEQEMLLEHALGG
jgi:2-oxoglutarate dehydrogenase E1 component